MLRILLILILSLICRVANAHGYGWWASSFDWKDFEKNMPAFNRMVQEETLKYPKEDPLTHRQYAVRAAFYYDKKDGAIIIIKDEGPGDLEFYTPDVLKYAYDLQRSRGIETMFSAFRFGLDFQTGSPLPCGANNSDEWWCLSTYVMLNPKQVKAFYAEVSEMNSKISHPKNDSTDIYSTNNYMKELEAVLKKTSKRNKALIFLVFT